MVTLVAEGLTNKQIAVRLIVSVATVKAHVEHALAKGSVHNRVGLATRYGAAAAWLQPPY